MTYVDHDVTLTIKASTRVTFAMHGREGTVITKTDAIDNAIGSIPDEVFSMLEDNGFTLAYPIEGEVAYV